MNKFEKYYSTDEKISELSEYVHINFHLISTKMISEMRRKLDISPSLSNAEYISLLVSLYGRMFNELVYSLCGLCQSTSVKCKEILPLTTLQILLDLLEDKNVLNGRMRNDIKTTLENKNEYYLKHIDELRKVIEALPK